MITTFFSWNGKFVNICHPDVPYCIVLQWSLTSLEEAEDEFVQVELPSFGCVDHRAEISVWLAHQVVLPVYGMVDQHHANGSRLGDLATRERLR